MNQFFCRSLLNKRSGFTLVEMLVSVSIIMILSVVMIINFNAGKHKDDLRNSAYYIASIFHQAQDYTLGGKTYDFGGEIKYSEGGYGIFVSTQDDAITLFADTNPDGYFAFGDDQWYDEPDQNNFDGFTYYTSFHNVELDNNLNHVIYYEGQNLRDTNDASFSYVFVPPFGDRRINNNTGLKNFGLIEFVVCSPYLSDEGIIISSNAASGQIIVSDIIPIANACQ